MRPVSRPFRAFRDQGEAAEELTRRRVEALSRELAGAYAEAAPVHDPVGVPGSAPAPPAARPQQTPPRLASAPGRHARRPVPPTTRVAAWVADRLPPALQGRAQVGQVQLGALAVLVAAGLLVTAWWVYAARSHPVEDAPLRPVVAPGSASEPSLAPVVEAGEGGPATGASAEQDGAIVVDVAGEVRRPGIVVLPLGSRVVDAIEAAGGARRGVDLRTLNLARPLSDGEQVLVGALPGALGAALAPGAVAPPPGGGLVNLNTADAATLDTLPGVGPVTAAAILEWREQHGGFTSVDELLEVSGIGEKTLAELKPHITL